MDLFLASIRNMKRLRNIKKWMLGKRRYTSFVVYGLKKWHWNQKHSLEELYIVFLTILQIHRKTSALNSLLNKKACLMVYSFIKQKKIRHRYFPVSFLKFLKRPTLQNISNECLSEINQTKFCSQKLFTWKHWWWCPF